MDTNDSHQSSGTPFTPNPYCLPRKAVFLLKRICVRLSHHVFDPPILCLLTFHFLPKSCLPKRYEGTILPPVYSENQFEAPGYPAVCSLPKNGVVSAWHAHSPVKLFPNRCEEQMKEWPSGHPLNLVRSGERQRRHVEYVDEYSRAWKKSPNGMMMCWASLLPKLHMHIVSPSWIWLKQRWSKSPQTTWGFRRDFFPEHFLSSETRNCCCFSANGACNWRALCRTWSLSFAHVHTIIYILFIICTLTSLIT